MLKILLRKLRKFCGFTLRRLGLYSYYSSISFVFSQAIEVCAIYRLGGYIRISYNNYKLYYNITKNIITPEHVIIDVGANDGWFAKIIYHFLPDAKVVSFEPLHFAQRKLQKIKSKYKNFEYHNIALGDEITEKEIIEYGTTGLSSFCELKANEYNIPNFSTDIRDKYKVKVSTLDEQFKHEKSRMIVKIDVQGYEMEVLKGAKELFARNQIDYVIIELMNKQKYKGQALANNIIEFMFDYNFEIYDLNPIYYEKTDGQLSEFDAVFRNINFLKGVE